MMAKLVGGAEVTVRPKMTSYAFFIQSCRQELRNGKDNEQNLPFVEFSRKCSERWKAMTPKEKKAFEQMALADKERFQHEMVGLLHERNNEPEKKTRTSRDPNAPKRPMTSFLFFCNAERAKVRADFPNAGVGTISRELGKRWESCADKAKFDALALVDKERYTKEFQAYKAVKRMKISLEQDSETEQSKDVDGNEDVNGTCANEPNNSMINESNFTECDV